jgi:hypothetical protein
MAKRNYTRELLKAQREGKTIVISLQPHDGIPVRYEPRHATDPMPWVADLPYRFSGRECHAVAPGAPQYLKDRVLVTLAEYNCAYDTDGGEDWGFDYTTPELMAGLRGLAAEGLVEIKGAFFSVTEAGRSRLDNELEYDSHRKIA